MSDIETPIFHLEKVVKAKTEDMEDFTGPLDLILSLLAKNKMEISSSPLWRSTSAMRALTASRR